MKLLTFSLTCMLFFSSFNSIAQDQPKKSGLLWNWSCQFPTSVPAASASQQEFDLYSWQMFIALNWPAQAGQRGQPDCTQVIGDAGPVVWQTYKDVEEIFLPDAANPGPWNSPLTTEQLSSINIAALKNTNVVQAVDQAVGGWLIDQRGNPTYYEISANETSYNYIVSNNFYNADVVSKANNINFPNFATEVKASWRMLTSSDDSSRYLTMQAQVAEFNAQGQPTGGSNSATLGLVGLHIITKAAGYPQWIWSTFEQVDNVPPKVQQNGQWVNNPQQGVFYSFFDASIPAAALNQSPCNWQQQGTQLVCVPKTGITFQTPNPLDRVTPLAANTQQINSAVQLTLSDTLYKYYQLVTTQRPLMPDNPSNPLGQPTPALSANVTMESYIQPNSSCMNCHSMATPVNSAMKSDFSYLFKFAQAPASSKTSHAKE
ncbi:hypothetical protein [Rheinheimera faecalis]|uniref:hypothetical protein n=1 Tax=Rheinheimera faecalis TaxID=2901141 RepID=UPI001E606F87|nr:hypothetical protein [Rheinheimera faecalis]